MVRSGRAGRGRRPRDGATGSGSLRLVPDHASDDVAAARDELADCARMDAALRTVLRGVRRILEQERAAGRDRSPERVARLVCRHIRAVMAAESPEVTDGVVVGALLWAAVAYEGPTLALDRGPRRG